MRLIPGKTKVRVELFKGVSLTDMLVGFIAVATIAFVVASSLPGKLYIAIGLVILSIVLLARMDTEPNYMYLVNILRHYGYKRSYERILDDEELVKKNSVNMMDFALDVMQEEEEIEPEPEEEHLSYGDYVDKIDEWLDDEKTLIDGDAPQEDKERVIEKRSEKSKEKHEFTRKKQLSNAEDMADIISFTDIKDDYIEYGGKYYGAAIELTPVEFRFFSMNRRSNSIDNAFGKILRSINADYSANIVKIERPILYDDFLKNEYKKIDELKATYERGIITEDELKARIEVLYERINELEDLCYDNQVVESFYYVVFFDSNKNQLENTVRNALDNFTSGEMKAKRLDSKGLAVFLRYNYQIDFDEREIENIAPEDYAAWAMPDTVVVTPRTVKINNIITHNMRVVDYPAAVGDAWMAGLMSVPATKVVVKCRPMDHTKSVRSIDHSLQELRGQYESTGVDSKRIELAGHIETLSSLLELLQGGNETLLSVNIYVTAYDIAMTRSWFKDTPEKTNIANIANMKRTVRRVYQESKLRLNNMEFCQTEAFIGGQISGYDPLFKDGRGMPSNSVAGMYPWIYARVCDKNGIKLGASDGVPVFIDFFRRDSERVNSNMVIVGKSGSGKSYATKSLLANLAAENSKIFILDPENEYSELAENLHGKFINVGNAQFGRLNPFHIITSLGDDETDDDQTSGSYATHLQFLEEFFHQILPDCDKDAMEYLNSLIDRMYTNMGITEETNLSLLRPEDYPTFDDLYDSILSEFQSTDNDYIRTMLRTLMNYVSKFSTGGRNANIWNGPSSITTDENFTVFNFQSLLANRNGAIANAQMLLVLKYIDNEIIKNRDYNTKYHLNRKVVVVIDEAHVFIDTKYPAALDFMFQLAKRIRKYNGMQIVITQNIKDFVGSEEIARKSTAIINACQYSFIFSLSPNDMDDLCKLYEKAGGLNENEQEQIIAAARGQAFTVMSPQSRSSFKIEVPKPVISMFKEVGFKSHYFEGVDGADAWEKFVSESREKRVVKKNEILSDSAAESPEEKKHVTFIEMNEEEFEKEREAETLEKERIKREKEDAQREKERLRREREEERRREEESRRLIYTEVDEDGFDFTDIPDIPETPEEFAAMYGEKAQESEPVQTPIVQEIPVQIPPAPQVVVQQSAAGSDTEKLLSELLGKFSHDAMMEEIRRSVREEIEKEISSRMPAYDSQTLDKKTDDDTSEGTSEASSFADIFSDGTYSEDTYSENEDSDDDSDEDDESSMIADLIAQQETSSATLGNIFDFAASDEESSSDDDTSSLDLMNLIMQQAESIDNVSPIEMMEDYGDTELEITLEELIQYNVNMRKKAMEEEAW